VRRVQGTVAPSQQEWPQEVRQKLVGVTITLARLRALGLSAASKGKWGHFNERLLGLKANSDPSPDFGERGDLKTTVRDRGGEFRESIKIGMASHDPLPKLARIILVIARDQNDATDLKARVVRNEEVVLLEPTTVMKHALLRDLQLLRKNPKSKETYFLETRTAGSGSRSARAYYLKASRLQEYVDRVPKVAAFQEVQQRLRWLKVTSKALMRAGYLPGAKGRFGNYVRSILPGLEAFELRTGVVDAKDRAKEDLLVCAGGEDPIDALRNVAYVPMRVLSGGGTSSESRQVLDVMYLAPSELIVHALEHDKRLVRRNRANEALFLRLKTHYAPSGAKAWSWYIKAQAVHMYAAALRNQPV